MIRLFLQKKIMTSPVPDEVTKPDRTPRHNRRIFSRYAVDHKHLTLMNDQDILLLKEVSAKGFSSLVSPRAFEKFAIGDEYEAKLRYLGEVYSINIRVTWKESQIVGFAVTKAHREALDFFQRLLWPMAIAASLKLVNSKFTTEGEHGQTWYHGDDDSDLFLWQESPSPKVTAFRLVVKGLYVAWNDRDDLATGSLKKAEQLSPLQTLTEPLVPMPDDLPDARKLQLALDILMSLQGQDGHDEDQSQALAEITAILNDRKG